ncbi:hypothetical protein HHK36_010642 [Tetracentron sinense]|uniref:No apical meristem-associated C-terminal domain-containing protein n=1 Tax=Tetracentron sinense TaxID=13715 RepID=A0A835DGM2_TETSI|nr:hypothetical protein HHK36_010642 [Tetracentron sinense]
MDSQDQRDMSFMDILHEDANMANSVLGESQQNPMSVDYSQPQVVMAHTKKPQRGSNFSIEEDKLLVSSWLNVGMDPVQGTDQKHNQFWERCHAYFHAHKDFPTERIYSSLMNRWSIIQKSVSKFTACLHQIEHLNQSGTTEHDKIQKARSLYRSQNKDVAFPYEHCWNLLKGEQKWLYHGNKDKQRRNSSVATSANVTHTPSSILEGEGDNVSNGNNVDFERPIGRKAEKAKRKRKEGPSEDVAEFMKKKVESLEDARVQGEEMIRLEKERLQLEQLDREDKMDIERKKLHLLELDRVEKMNIERRKLHLQELDREERIMMIDSSMMFDFQQQYWKARQKEIIESQQARNLT